MPVNEMGFEVYPEGIYKILKQFLEMQTKLEKSHDQTLLSGVKTKERNRPREQTSKCKPTGAQKYALYSCA